jgi:hypothetical protein
MRGSVMITAGTLRIARQMFDAGGHLITEIAATIRASDAVREVDVDEGADPLGVGHELDRVARTRRGRRIRPGAGSW